MDQDIGKQKLALLTTIAIYLTFIIIIIIMTAEVRCDDSP